MFKQSSSKMLTLYSCIMFKSITLWDDYLTRSLELKKETRQGAISADMWPTSSWNWCQTIEFLSLKPLATDRQDMSPYPRCQARAQLNPSKINKRTNPEVAKLAFSTWPLQNSQPVECEVCLFLVSGSICQSPDPAPAVRKLIPSVK